MNAEIFQDDAKHDCRYYVQYEYIPEIVDYFNMGIVSYEDLLPSVAWEEEVTDFADIEDYEPLTAEEIEVDENHVMILYTFPEPEQSPEAKYGAVLYDKAEEKAVYYTLEMGCMGGWMRCSKSVDMHRNFGHMESSDKEAFKQWVIGRIGNEAPSFCLEDCFEEIEEI